MAYLKEIIFYGIGGMGVVTAAEVLTEALAHEGKYGQAIPFYGMERRGAPVKAFSRISDAMIPVRSEVYEPDYVVVIEPTLLTLIDVTKGLKTGGLIIANTAESPGELRKKLPSNIKAATVNATKIALDILKLPITNTAMLGAFSKATKEARLESLLKAVSTRFPGALGQRNIEAVERAYEETQTG
jgi:2-oxoacid:acceptor oxidoreductase gamma subunit (pyruvate/2-ketoisovalerate family)